MKIAIVAPSPTPFTIGGAEKLWFGLERYINQETNHQCELIKIPIKEKSFWDLIDAYNIFYRLDLSHFDMVISGKYPAWITPHHNHHIYMLHTLRGLYDDYDTNHKLVYTKDVRVQNILNYIQQHNATISRVLSLLNELRDNKTISKEFFAFPAPFIREIVHFFDKKAMEGIKSFSAISNTVTNRRDYFPPLSPIKVIYPPSTLSNFKNSGQRYFFTASRLDTPKRIDMLINAYKKVNTTIPLKIAGTGAIYNELYELAKDDNRIELLGFISDKELIEYYANAYAIIFIPKEEDYGLITIEAMSCAKAVITCSDSGGVLEFVKHHKTGLISKPSIEDLTKQISFLSNNPSLAIEMGRRAKKSVANISWRDTVNNLLKYPIQLTIVSTYPIYPSMGGGQNRVFYLYRELANYFNITIISLVHHSVKYSKKEISSNLYEIQVPKSKIHQDLEEQMQHQAGIPITDIALIELYNLTPNFIEEVKKSVSISDYTVMTSPYVYPLLKEHTSKPIIYESQNVEYLLKEQMLKPSDFNRKLLQMLFKVEQESYLNAVMVTVCAKEDAISFNKLYGNHYQKILPFIPNGVDLETVTYYSKNRKKRRKENSKYREKRVALFIGSEHAPNIEAVYKIIDMAKENPYIIFLIIGGVYRAFERVDTPKNLEFTKFIDNAQKEQYLTIADMALNPMLSGSGSNLKMLDYLASGLPVITTPIGARGLNLPKGTVVQSDIENFSSYFDNIHYIIDTKRAKRFVQKEYNWKSIAQRLKKELFKIISQNKGKRCLVTSVSS